VGRETVRSLRLKILQQWLRKLLCLGARWRSDVTCFSRELNLGSLVVQPISWSNINSAMLATSYLLGKMSVQLWVRVCVMCYAYLNSIRDTFVTNVACMCLGNRRKVWIPYAVVRLPSRHHPRKTCRLDVYCHVSEHECHSLGTEVPMSVSSTVSLQKVLSLRFVYRHVKNALPFCFIMTTTPEWNNNGEHAVTR
jgi:hypothetical protein